MLLMLPLAAAVKAHAHAIPSHTVDAELQNNLWIPADCACVEAVAAKAHVHAVPSCTVDTELQDSLLMFTGLVVKSAMDHACVSWQSGH